MIRWPWRALRRGAADGEREDPGEALASEVTSSRTVAGERGVTVVSRSRSLQSRLNGLLAGALAAGVGIAMLAWWYSTAMHRRLPSAAAIHLAAPAADTAPLPSLGPIEPPQHALAPAPDSDPATAAYVAALMDSKPQPLTAVGQAAMRETTLVPVAPAPRRASADAPLARQLTGAVFAQLGNVSGQAPASTRNVRDADTGIMPAGNESLPPARLSAGSGSETLGALLSATVQRAARARLLPQQRLLLPRGAFIDCTLETAIDSTLPGMTSCLTATDTFSADGTVVLLPRGTKLIGETRGEVRQGVARVFVIWTQARTPSGVIVPLDSPGTDALGRSGLTGKVNRHFWQRFGAALLISGIDAGAQSGLKSGNGTVLIDPMAAEDVLTGALRDSDSIPPTVDVPNGARIQVLVARDVDFRSVYELVPQP